MLTENLALLFERDILKVKQEISLYTEEQKLWIALPGTSNPGGNICLHLLGNLQHYIGGVLGGSGYQRNRPEEFSQQNIPVSKLVQSLDATAVLIPATIRKLSEKDLAAIYPEKVFEQVMTVEYFLFHLLAHLNYHLGQLNYHRRVMNREV